MQTFREDAAYSLVGLTKTREVVELTVVNLDDLLACTRDAIETGAFVPCWLEADGLIVMTADEIFARQKAHRAG